MAFKILVVDDDKNICELLRLYLEKEGYQVQFRSVSPDFILLDIMLPYLNGWQVCSEIRKESQVPILMLTAKGETADTVTGLELGADDYVVKPFDPKEIIARIKAVSRRTNPKPEQEKNNVIRYDKLVIDLTGYELYVDGKPVYTPPKE